MYGSYRFYIDKFPKEINVESVLNIIDMFSTALGIKFDKLIHTLYSQDKDEPIVYNEYINDVDGRLSFMNSGFIAFFKGKYGDNSAPSVTAMCDSSISELYAFSRIDVQLPYDSFPMIISLDFDYTYISNKVGPEGLKLFLCRLYDMGYRVNNSFYHIYFNKNTATTLDGGQIGNIISVEDRRNIKQAVRHRMNFNMNCMMDVFAVNSILSHIISDKTKDRIANIVGTSYVDTIAENFVFSIPYSKMLTSNYRLKHYRLVAKLRKVVNDDAIYS